MVDIKGIIVANKFITIKPHYCKYPETTTKEEFNVVDCWSFLNNLQQPEKLENTICITCDYYNKEE